MPAVQPDHVDRSDRPAKRDDSNPPCADADFQVALRSDLQQGCSALAHAPPTGNNLTGRSIAARDQLLVAELHQGRTSAQGQPEWPAEPFPWHAGKDCGSARPPADPVSPTGEPRPESAAGLDPSADAQDDQGLTHAQRRCRGATETDQPSWSRARRRRSLTRPS